MHAQPHPMVSIAVLNRPPLGPISRHRLAESGYQSTDPNELATTPIGCRLAVQTAARLGRGWRAEAPDLTSISNDIHLTVPPPEARRPSTRIDQNGARIGCGPRTDSGISAVHLTAQPGASMPVQRRVHVPGKHPTSVRKTCSDNRNFVVTSCTKLGADNVGISRSIMRNEHGWNDA